MNILKLFGLLSLLVVASLASPSRQEDTKNDEYGTVNHQRSELLRSIFQPSNNRQSLQADLSEDDEVCQPGIPASLCLDSEDALLRDNPGEGERSDNFNVMYRVCVPFVRSVDGRKSFTPSCVPKNMVDNLVYRGAIPAGIVFNGEYYDCKCKRTPVDSVDQELDQTDELQSGSKEEDENDRNSDLIGLDLDLNVGENNKGKGGGSGTPSQPPSQPPPSRPSNAGKPSPSHPVHPTHPGQSNNPSQNPSSPTPPSPTPPSPTPPSPPPSSIESVTNLALDVNQNTTCNMIRESMGVYRVSITVTMSNLFPSAVVIGLDSYNGRIRDRGSCDNRKTNTSEIWDNSLWNPTTNLNTPKWSIESVSNIANSNSAVVTYVAVFTLDELRACVSSNGTSNLVGHHANQNDTSIIDGTWYITKVIPESMSNASAGEIIQYSHKCHFQVHQSGGGIDTITYETQKSNSTLVVQWIRSLCTECGRVAFTLRTCFLYNSTQNISHGPYLTNPVAIKKNGACVGRPNNALSNDFTIAPLPGSNNASICRPAGLFGDQTQCCQEWIVNGISDKTEPPFHGPVTLAWTSVMGQPSSIPTAVISRKDDIIVTANVLVIDPCEHFNDIRVDDVMEGEIQLYRDAALYSPYECCGTNPLVESERVYAALHLAINASLCNEFSAVINNVTLIYYELATPVDVVHETILIFDITQPTLPASVEYMIIVPDHHDLNASCAPRVSWIIKKKYTPQTMVKVIVAWNVTHVPYSNQYPLLNGGVSSSMNLSPNVNSGAPGRSHLMSKGGVGRNSEASSDQENRKGSASFTQGSGEKSAFTRFSSHVSRGYPLYQEKPYHYKNVLASNSSSSGGGGFNNNDTTVDEDTNEYVYQNRTTRNRPPKPTRRSVNPPENVPRLPFWLTRPHREHPSEKPQRGSRQIPQKHPGNKEQQSTPLHLNNKQEDRLVSHHSSLIFQNEKILSEKTQKLQFARFTFNELQSSRPMEITCLLNSYWDENSRTCRRSDREEDDEFTKWFPGRRGHEIQTTWLKSMTIVFLSFMVATLCFYGCFRCHGYSQPHHRHHHLDHNGRRDMGEYLRG